MLKNKYLGAAWIAASVALLGVGGFFIWHAAHKTGTSYGTEAGIASSGVASNNEGTTNSGQLKAEDSSPSSTGQLNNQNGQNLTGQTNNSSNSSSSPAWPDPSTFAQYDSYKNKQNASFADVVKGTGTELTNGHYAAVYYKGFLTNGTIFDQSRPDSSGQVQPFVFQLGAHQVITGWEEGLAGMKVGGARLLIIPPSAGYGSTGQGSIPPNSVLVFEVQLVQVQ